MENAERPSQLISRTILFARETSRNDSEAVENAERLLQLISSPLFSAEKASSSRFGGFPTGGTH